MEALWLGLLLYIQNGIEEVEIEGDSQLCVQEITLGNSQNWRISDWIAPIKEFLGKLTNFSLMNVYRETNKVADFLDNWGVFPEVRVIANTSTRRWPGLQEIIDQDYNGSRVDIPHPTTGP